MLPLPRRLRPIEESLALADAHRSVAAAAIHDGATREAALAIDSCGRWLHEAQRDLAEVARDNDHRALARTMLAELLGGQLALEVA